jgi:hypothetical protein
MRFELEVIAGPEAGRRLALPHGAPVSVGWAADADLPLAHDAYMSPVHAAFSFDGATARVRDLASEHGTFVNQQAVHEGEVRDGDLVQLGSTVLRVRALTDEPAASGRPAFLGDAAVTFDDRVQHVTWFMRRAPGVLFAIVDAARDDRALGLLQGAVGECVSLYEGWTGESLSDVAPYLVRLTDDDALLEALLQHGWGQAWGVFFTSEGSVKELRRHLRHFLRVQDEDGNALLFRFYDPRVLRAYLGTCTPYETQTFFGPVEAFIIEGRRGATLLHSTPRVDGVAVYVEDLPESMP